MFDLTVVLSALALGIAIASLCFTIYLAGIKNATRIAKIELKVDTMWSFQMRRAMSEVVEKNLGVMESPLVFNSHVIKELDPMKEALQTAYHRRWVGLTDAEMLLEIERDFGDQLIHRVCIPHNLSHGACLLLALTIAKGINSVDMQFRFPAARG